MRSLEFLKDKFLQAEYTDCRSNATPTRKDVTQVKAETYALREKQILAGHEQLKVRKDGGGGEANPATSEAFSSSAREALKLPWASAKPSTGLTTPVTSQALLLPPNEKSMRGKGRKS